MSELMRLNTCPRLLASLTSGRCSNAYAGRGHGRDPAAHDWARSQADSTPSRL